MIVPMRTAGRNSCRRDARTTADGCAWMLASVVGVDIAVAPPCLLGAIEPVVAGDVSVEEMRGPAVGVQHELDREPTVDKDRLRLRHEPRRAEKQRTVDQPDLEDSRDRRVLPVRLPLGVRSRIARKLVRREPYCGS